MANRGLDLTDYGDVSANAQHIYDRVRPGGETPRMPLGQLPWSQAWVDKFKSWIDQGWVRLFPTALVGSTSDHLTILRWPSGLGIGSGATPSA
jgi:hypothetical protein